MDISKKSLTAIIVIMLNFGVHNNLIASNNNISNNNITNIKISPTEIFFKADQQVTSIKIKNLSSEKVYLKAKLLKWELAQNKNSYTDSQDLSVGSELISVEPNKEESFNIQRSKIAMNRQTPVEQTYRLILQTINVPPLKQNSNSNAKVNNPVAQNWSMPIFVKASKPTNLPVQWSKKIINDHALELSVYNPNNNHKIIDKIAIKNKLDNNLYQQDNAYIYLLAKQKYTLQIELDKNKNQSSDLNSIKMVLNTKESANMIG